MCGALYDLLVALYFQHSINWTDVQSDMQNATRDPKTKFQITEQLHTFDARY